MHPNDADIELLKENFDDFFDHALCGYVIADKQGRITRCNQTLAQWLGHDVNMMTGKNVSDLLTIGGKIYYETHLGPLLRMRGNFDEIALELAGSNHHRLPVLLHGMERRNEHGEPLFLRFTFFKAVDRHLYEKNLKEAKANLEISLANSIQVTVLREQLIAILGHDLRNPLGSIISASDILSRSLLAELDNKMVQIIQRSAARMNELIKNIMDFARTRLGEGIIVNRQPTDVEPIVQEVVEELQTIFPNRQIVIECQSSGPVLCDGPRIAQLLSNLLSNALTHGFAGTPVFIRTSNKGEDFILSVTNEGHHIPTDRLTKIFEPFSREEFQPSQNGLGLGLYIVAQITKAHKGEIKVTSTEQQTMFTFQMPNKA